MSARSKNDLLETKGQLAQAVSQNEKLTYTLREAREHIAALREEVDKLTQPPNAYGTVLSLNDDDTVDVFASGRKMRVSVHPDLDTGLKRGQEVVLNESLNVVMARGFDSMGEVVTIKEVLEDGHRALIVGRADEERCANWPTTSWSRACAAATRCSWIRDPACCSKSCPAPRSKNSCSKKSPTSATKTSVASTARSSRSPTPSSCRSSTPTSSSTTGCRRPRASCSTARRVAARRSSPRPSPTRSPRRWPRRPATSRRSYFLNIKGPELLNKYVGETERQIRLVFQRAREERGGLARHRLLRRDGLAVPHPRLGHQLRHGVDHRAAVAGRDRRRRGVAQRHRHRCVQPRRPHRSGDPAAGPSRREDQDRASPT